MQHRIKVGELEYRAWRYRYILLFALSVIAAVVVLVNSAVGAFLSAASEWAYAGAFIIGFFYTNSLTSPVAAAAFFVATKSLDPFIAAAIGGTAAMLADLLLFNIFKADLLPEARLLAKDLRLPKVRFGHWLKFIPKIAPFIAGFIIASPLPDEFGIAILGAMNYGTKKFILISWVCNTLGLLAIALLRHAI